MILFEKIENKTFRSKSEKIPNWIKCKKNVEYFVSTVNKAVYENWFRTHIDRKEKWMGQFVVPWPTYPRNPTPGSWPNTDRYADDRFAGETDPAAAPNAPEKTFQTSSPMPASARQTSLDTRPLWGREWPRRLPQTGRWRRHSFPVISAPWEVSWTSREEAKRPGMGCLSVWTESARLMVLKWPVRRGNPGGGSRVENWAVAREWHEECSLFRPGQTRIGGKCCWGKYPGIKKKETNDSRL